jgi:hypothetical protein
VLTGDANAYRYFGEGAFINIYRWFFLEVVPQNVVLWAALITIYEVCVGLLIFSRGRYVRFGLLLSGILQIMLVPLGWFGFMNVLLAVGSLMLIPVEFEDNIVTVVRYWIRGSK